MWESNKSKEINISRTKICHAEVGKALTIRNKNILTLSGTICDHFPWAKQMKKKTLGLFYFPLWADRQLSPARPSPGPSPGSSPAQAQPRPGPSPARSGNLGSNKIKKIIHKKHPNIKILKIKIRVAQNVGKAWIGRKTSSWPHFMPFQAFFAWARKM